jgi:uncharacterized phage protein (TIGR01671 family)
MREIKFRAWNEKRKDFIYVGSIDFVNSECRGMAYDIQEGDDEISCNINLLEQFTGLHDKNGKDIYEGDILEYSDAPGMSDDIASVTWHAAEACFYVVNGSGNVFDPIYNVSTSCNVIGNIHENPELIK